MDGHAKNLSLMTQGNRTQLARFYDLVCSAVYRDLSQKLAFKIGEKNRPKWLMARHWQRFAEDVAVKPKFIHKLIAEIIEWIELVLPHVALELKAVVSNPEELQMI